MTWTRREFLAAQAGLAASVVASSCAQLDRVIVGDGADESQRVMILGGGVAGLVAARELKKNNVRFRVFEGSNRIGGRTFSLSNFNEAQQSVDLGAEWFSEDDDFLLNLCRELKVDLEAIPWAPRAPWFVGGDKVTESINWERDLTHFKTQVLEAKARKSDQYLDAMSAHDLFESYGEGLPSLGLQYLHQTVLRYWGQEAQQISALGYLDRFGDDPSAVTDLKKRRFRIVGGAQNLALALHDKIAGIVPEYIYLKNHRLVEIRENRKNLEMIFETPKGSYSIAAKTVICTLPLSVLRNIKGIDSIGLSDHRLQLIRELQYGSSGKIVSSYGDRFWPKDRGTWIDSREQSWIWDSTPESSTLLPVRRGILTSQWAGSAGAQMGVESLEAHQALAAKIGKTKPGPMESWQIMNWELNPWSLGSVSYLGKGQVTKFAGSLAAPERQGRFLFAGEHTAYDNMSSLNGAVESGIRAALEASRFKSEFL